MSDTPHQSPPPAGADPLMALHKMSRTAGLGDNQYVAVNVVAVASVFFGLASALVIFDAVFLIVPAAAIALAVAALYQIAHSNGTQTGRSVAIIGIVLAVGFSGVLGFNQIRGIYLTREHESEIASTIAGFGTDVAARNYDSAYARFSDRFTAAMPKDAFKERLEYLQNNPGYGQIKNITWNGRSYFDTDGRTNQPIARSVALVELTSGAVDRQEVHFIQQAGKWKIDGIPMYFPPPAQPKSQFPPGAAAVGGPR